MVEDTFFHHHIVMVILLNKEFQDLMSVSSSFIISNLCSFWRILSMCVGCFQRVQVLVFLYLPFLMDVSFPYLVPYGPFQPEVSYHGFNFRFIFILFSNIFFLLLIIFCSETITVISIPISNLCILQLFPYIFFFFLFCVSLEFFSLIFQPAHSLCSCIHTN